MENLSIQWLTVLGLEPGATLDEIKEAHRDLAKVWHPDRFGHDLRLRAKAEERLKEINGAYEGLMARVRARAGRPQASARPGKPAGAQSRVVQQPPPAPNVHNRHVRMPLPYVDVRFGVGRGQLVDLSLSGGQFITDVAPVVGTEATLLLEAHRQMLALPSRVIRVSATTPAVPSSPARWAVSVAFVNLSGREQQAIPHFYSLLLDATRKR
jgi:hypothetical protein